MQDELKNSLIIASLSTLTILAVIGIVLIDMGEGSLYKRVDAPLQDALIRLRNSLHEQPISEDITLIGIGDDTMDALGRFGQGLWQTRQPYIEHLKYYREYGPSVVAYDLLFKEEKGEQEQEQVIQVTEQVLNQMIEALKGVGQGLDIRDNHLLLAMSEIIVQQGNNNLASAFSEVSYDENSPTFIYAYAKMNKYENQEGRLSAEFASASRGPVTAAGMPANQPEDAVTAWTPRDIVGQDGTSDADGEVIPYLRDVRIPLELTRNLPADFNFTRVRANVPTGLLLDTGLLGFIHVPREFDGVVRRYALVWGTQYSYEDPETGETVTKRLLLPSMALLAVLSHVGIDLPDRNWEGSYEENGEPVIEVDFGRELVIRPPDLAPIRIPIDRYGYMLVDFVGGINDFTTLAFHKIERDRAEIEPRLKDKIVYLGLTVTGGTDTGPTVVAPYTPWVLVHMSVTNNMLTNTFIEPTSTRLKVGLLLVLWLLITPAASFLRARPFVFISIGLLLAYLATVYGAIVAHAFVLPLAAPATFLTLSCLGTVLYRYVTEEKEKQRIRDMFATMVSDDVLQYMEENPESFSLAGQRREATMFFSDVAGFTTISESLPPDKLVELLNQYLSPTTEIVLESDGFVDKYEGDAIMAEWGVPYPNPDHAKLACWAALDQQKRLAELRPDFKRDFGVDIYVRMGLNSGVVSAGNMGSAKRFSYTVMGDAVNQAARFEPANKDYDTEIMIGETTFEGAKDFIEARLLDQIIVKGKTQPIRIYELMAKKGEASEDQLKIIEHYEEGLRTHWERHWDDAIACFEKALALDPEDGPSLALRKRIQFYKDNPPDDTWQGEYVRKTKD